MHTRRLGPFCDGGLGLRNNATREKLGNERANIFVAIGVFKRRVLRIYASHLDETQERPSISGKVILEAHDIPRAHHRYLLQDRFCNICKYDS